jgi:hypothetical protein
MAIKFKGIDLEADLERIVPHMAAAEEYGGVLQQLQSVWDNLSLLGQLSGTGTDMSGTRRAFNELAVSLLNQLGKEALKKCLQDMGSKAQVAINILVRNLFERTADIGFLACDEDIRAFLRTVGAATDRDDPSSVARRPAQEAVFRAPSEPTPPDGPAPAALKSRTQKLRMPVTTSKSSPLRARQLREANTATSSTAT